MPREYILNKKAKFFLKINLKLYEFMIKIHNQG